MHIMITNISQAAIDERLSAHIKALTHSLAAGAPKGTKPERIVRDAARLAKLMAEVKSPRTHRADLIAWGDMLWEISDVLGRYGLAIAPIVETAIVPRTGKLPLGFERWDGAPR